MKSFIQQIKSGSPVLFYTGLLHWLLVILFLTLLLVDHRLINQESVWIKPLRFAISIGMFTWTYAWFSRFIEKRQRLFNILNTLMAWCMLLEIFFITWQAARGTASHFNIQTAWDATIFSIMGGAIGLNAILLAIWLYAFVFLQKGGAEYRTAIIWGMSIFLLGNLSGYLIIRYGWPKESSVMVSKIPILGWKSGLKDLKISHALGLHAIQVVPLAQTFFLRQKASTSLIHVVGLAYLILYLLALTHVFI